MSINITSFGYLHGDAPEADITIDLRKHFRDPHVSPEMRYLTANDEQVRHAVMRTPGINDVVRSLTAMVSGYMSGPGLQDSVTVAIGCSGGRHRAPTVANEVARRLGYSYGARDVNVTHLNIEFSVVDR